MSDSTNSLLSSFFRRAMGRAGYASTTVRAMARRDEIVAHLDELLGARGWDDYGPNGLQVIGRDEVELVVTGVSAHRELFERAAEAGAAMVLCHHGIFWRSTPQAVGAQMKGR